MTLAEWTLLALLNFAPPERHVGKPWADSSRADTVSRYEGIRDAITSQCSTRSCAALLVAIAVGESGLARDADVGPCHREGAFRGRCDGGLAASAWQVHAHGVDKDGKTVTVARLFAERELAAGIVLRVARGSLRQCKHLPEEQRLANLGGGRCRPSRSATARWRLWQVVSAWTPNPSESPAESNPAPPEAPKAPSKPTADRVAALPGRASDRLRTPPPRARAASL